MKYCKIYFWACYIFLTMFVFSSCKDEIETPRFGSCKKIVNKNELEIYYNNQYSSFGLLSLNGSYIYYFSETEWKDVKLKDLKCITSKGKKFYIYKNMIFYLRKSLEVIKNRQGEVKSLYYDNRENSNKSEFFEITVEGNLIKIKCRFLTVNKHNIRVPKYSISNLTYKTTEIDNLILMALSELLLSNKQSSVTDSLNNNVLIINYKDSNKVFKWYYEPWLEIDLSDERQLIIKYLQKIWEDNSKLNPNID